MRKSLPLILAVIVALALGATAVDAQSDLVGYWHGRASYQGDDLPIELTFESTGAAVTGSMSAPTLRAYGYPLRDVRHTVKGVTFELVGDASSFLFRGNVSGNSLTGTWNLFGVTADVVMTRSTPKSEPYRRESITCRNGDVTLAGTLFTPQEAGKHPAVVFVHGSGAETRYASSFLADRLARARIATLIFDKRGAGASTGNWREADFNDLAADVLACVEVLTRRDDIEPTRIGLSGASQAGWIAPLAASRSSDIAFIALVSGPAVPVWREGWWDTEFRMRGRAFGDREIERARAILKLNDDVTRTGAGLPELTRLLEAASAEPWFQSLNFQQALPADAPFRQFYRRILDFDPLPVLQRLSIPSLWLLGERDAEMPSAETAAALEQLRAQGKPVTSITFAGADHSLFITETGPVFRWPRLAPGYVDTFTDWVIATAQAR